MTAILIQPPKGKVHLSKWFNGLISGKPTATLCGHDLKKATIWDGKGPITCIKCANKAKR